MNSSLLDVLAGRKPRRRPIWFMRQAGRYLPEYRELRARAGSFLSLCYSPELAAEVTLQPLRRFDLDAAILFADILVVPQAMGLELRFEEGEGPVLERVSDLAGVKGLKPVGSTRYVSAVCQTVRNVRANLDSSVGLIGFCGAPWTVASYMVEGGGSDRVQAKIAAYDNAQWFEELVERLVGESIDYLSAQIEAGAQAVQIFDSWAGDLVGHARWRYVIEPVSRMCREIRRRYPSVGVIVFARGVGRDHGVLAKESGAQAIGVETEERINDVLDSLPEGCGVQGNLDPVMLLASEKSLREEVRQIVKSVPMERHIFNLGHGIRQQTPPEHITAAITEVRLWDSGGR